ncbi:MAG: hypothetical protein U0798_14245 [Gemmataceae bacterium]
MFIVLCVLNVIMAPFLAVPTHTAAKFDVAKETRTADESIAEPIRKELEETALVISEGGTERLVFWFRKAIPSRATAEQIKNGLTYRELPETGIVGVVRLSKPFVDYRKQEIPEGLYTLRLGFQPENGDHMGTAPYTEFLLLSPVKEDRTLDETDLKTVVAMSKKATGGDHPSVMLLFPNRDWKEVPSIEEKECGVSLLQLKRPLTINGKEAAIGMGIVIAGFSKTR